jgi:hypothetical protein
MGHMRQVIESIRDAKTDEDRDKVIASHLAKMDEMQQKAEAQREQRMAMMKERKEAYQAMMEKRRAMMTKNASTNAPFAQSQAMQKTRPQSFRRMGPKQLIQRQQMMEQKMQQMQAMMQQMIDNQKKMADEMSAKAPTAPEAKPAAK